jgi:L,D-transpeptidase ErfK/SrfK
VPVGTQVRVVNQPFVFGWHEGQLYLQPYDVLEDDARDWKKSRLSKVITANQLKGLKTRGEQVNWDLVAALAREPRGVPVPVSLVDSSIDQVLAAATTVQNKVPDGSTWDGKTDLPMDEGTFRQMMSDVDPKSGDAQAAAPESATSSPSGPVSQPGAPMGQPGGPISQPSNASPASATPASASPATTPVVKPRTAGPPVTSTAGSPSQSTE